MRLVGRGADGGISSFGINIDGLGWVADAGSEIETWSAMIIPIQQGGGTRIKIAEAFARRCPVITTSVGAYGYELENGREAMLADSPSAFANACIEVVRNTLLCERITKNAYQKYMQYWTWEAQAAPVAEAVNHCLNRKEV